MTNGYTQDRMDLVQVCEWLTKKGHKETAALMASAFNDHVWTVNGMLRTDIIKEILNMHDDMLFRELECEVTTHMQFIPDAEAHVD